MRNKNAKVSDPNSFVSDPGDRIHKIYAPRVNPDGTIDLVEAGQEDLQALYDSYRDQCDMAFIVNRLMMGDLSVLSQKEPFYADLTQFPKTYAEALQLVIDAEANFLKLPLDVRQQFDNDYRQWFAQAGSETWYNKMDSVLIKEESPKEEEVSES